MPIDQPRLLKSYVWHRPSGKCFFVSTIERESSSPYAHGRTFAETIVWDYDWDKQERGAIVTDTGSGPPFDQHMEVCRQLFDTGKYVEGDES